jgi:hypothetical protein
VLQFVRNGHQVRWLATDTGPPTTAMVATADNIMEDLLLRFEGLFSEPTGLPSERQRCHHIRLLPGTAPVAVRPYRYAHTQKAELERQCQDMLRQGVIRASSSAFSASMLLVRKADSSWRFCVDYRALNSRTVKDKYPIPVVEELLNEPCGAVFFTKLDLRSGYHQVRMNADDIEKTAFRTHEGLFEFLVMPFGLANAPATFQALMHDVLPPFLHRFVLVFFNDILIFSLSWLEHLRHIHLVLAKLQGHQLYVKRSKCSFVARSVAYLGHVISAAGIKMDVQKVKAVLDWPLPRSIRAVRTFLGLAGYYRRFVKDYGNIAAPLTRLLCKDAFKWGPEAEAAFRALQRALTTAPLLQLPDFDRGFVVECDASDSGVGAVLHQGRGPIAFFRHPLAPRHSKLAAYERELIGLVQAVRHWRPYLWGRTFLICTDHYSLKYLLDQRLDNSPTSVGEQALRVRLHHRIQARGAQCGGRHALTPRHRGPHGGSHSVGAGIQRLRHAARGARRCP